MVSKARSRRASSSAESSVVGLPRDLLHDRDELDVVEPPPRDADGDLAPRAGAQLLHREPSPARGAAAGLDRQPFDSDPADQGPNPEGAAGLLEVGILQRNDLRRVAQHRGVAVGPVVTDLDDGLHVLGIALAGRVSADAGVSSGLDHLGEPLLFEVGGEFLAADLEPVGIGRDAEHRGAGTSGADAEEGAVAPRGDPGGVEAGPALRRHQGDISDPVPVDRVFAGGEGAVEQRHHHLGIGGKKPGPELEEQVMRRQRGRAAEAQSTEHQHRLAHDASRKGLPLQSIEEWRLEGGSIAAARA